MISRKPLKSPHITPEIERAIRIKAAEQSINGGKRLLMMGSPGLGVAELIEFETEVEHRIEKLQHLQQHNNA